jgi:hypothetical protein
MLAAMRRAPSAERRRFGMDLPGVVAAALALLLAGCLGVLTQDPRAARVVESAGPALPAPLRDSRPHWFLRQEDGWLGAHRAVFGGAPDEPVTIVRVARFRSAEVARAAFERLTPAYAFRLWGRRMAAEPAEVRYPHAFPGDAVRTLDYRPPRAPDEEDPGLTVQLVILRVDETVIVIESAGVPAEQLPAVARAMIAALRQPDAAIGRTP